MELKNLLYFIAGIVFYDGINHLIFAIKRSYYSVHGLYAGTTGNWIIFILDMTLTLVLIFFANYKLNKSYKNRIKH